MDNKLTYNVTLLIEDNISAQIWKAEIENFKNKLEGNIQFTNIDQYHFGENGKLSIVDDYKNPVNLLDKKLNDNNLVFIISDASSIVWRNNEVYNFLNELKLTSLVSIVNLMPKQIFIRHAIDIDNKVETTIIPNAQNNSQVTIEIPEYTYMTMADLKDKLIIPIANITKVDDLLNSMINGGRVENATIFKDNILDFNNGKISTAEDLVKRFRHVCQLGSIQAFQLAAFLSTTNSFTLSDVDLVRQHMLPTSDKSLLSEFMLGGIIEKTLPLEASNRIEFESTEVIGKDTPQAFTLTKMYSGLRTIPIASDKVEQRYKMKEGVSEVLRCSLRGIDDDKVQLLLKQKSWQDSRKEYEQEVKAKLKM